MSGLDLGSLGLTEVDDDNNPAPPAAPATPTTPVDAPGSATHGSVPSEPAPATPEPPAEPAAPEEVIAQAQNPDAVRALIDRERAAARAAYARAKAAEQELARRLEESMPTEERLRLETQRREAAEGNLLRFKVGLRHKLPEEVTDLLRGSNEEELEAHAQSLLPMLNLTPAAEPATTATPGAAPVVPVPTAGGYQTPPPAAPVDPAKAHGQFLAAALMGGRGPQQ